MYILLLVRVICARPSDKPKIRTGRIQLWTESLWKLVQFFSQHLYLGKKVLYQISRYGSQSIKLLKIDRRTGPILLPMDGRPTGMRLRFYYAT